jgi:anion-transporting  ArsA/GET3 family ATPase
VDEFLFRRIAICALFSHHAGAFLHGPGKIRPGEEQASAAACWKMSAVPDLLERRLVFVTGKGGVGKSTVSLALGLRAAAEGRRTIVCEVGGQETASRVFRKGEVGFNEVELAPSLWGISIDPDESLREYLLLQLKVRAMRDLLVRSRIFSYLAAATPGLKELVTIGKIWELAQPERRVKHGREYDLVIVDAPATGHSVGFLQAPRTFAGIARVGPVHSQAKALDSYLTNHELTAVAIVALPEEMPVNETASLERQLTDEVGIAVERIYMNGMYPDRFDGDDAGRLEQAQEQLEGPPRAAVRAALTEHRRALSEVQQLERLKGLAATPVTTLPYVFKPRLGVPELKLLAKALA